MDLPDHEMVNPSRSIKSEGLKAYSKEKLIGLEVHYPVRDGEKTHSKERDWSRKHTIQYLRTGKRTQKKN